MDGADVLVLGAGPAGWAAASACAVLGLRVRVVAPDPHAAWHQTYGAWLDELGAAGMTDVAGQQWDTVLVRTVGPEFRPVGRSYAFIDNHRLRTVLTDRAAGVSTVADRARRLEQRGDRLVTITASGARLEARAVIDATGHPAVFGAGPSPTLAYQTAFGIVAHFDRAPLPAETMCLMDFDASALTDRTTPTFLYAMDLGSGEWFVEETSLAARPALPIADLQLRLEQRLAARGCTPGRVLRTERVAFAMNAPVRATGATIAFGAAAGMVHPATGYHVAAALQRAPALAAAIHTALDERPGDLRAIARAGHRAVWADADLRRDALYRLGLDVLLALDTTATQAFFEGFFSLPAAEWRGYVSRTATPLAVQRTMLRLMLEVPGRVRRQVLQAVATGRPWHRLVDLVAPRGFSG